MPAGATYEPIATSSPTSSTSVTFSSLGSYTDIRIVVTYKSTGTELIGLRFNSDSGTNYSYTRMEGDGSVTESSRQTNGTQINYGRSSSSDNISMTTFDIFNYGGSTNKTVLMTQSADYGNGTGRVLRAVGLWRNTAAITSIEVRTSSTTGFQTGSMITLYGIKAA